MSPLHSSARIRIYLSDFEKGKTKMIEIIDNKIYVDGKAYPSVTNVGIRPSVDDGVQINCETHILDFNREIYGQKVKVEFLKNLRAEIHFTNLEALRDQIQKDIQATKAYFKEA